MFIEPSNSKERYEYVIWNHEKLIALLEGTSNNAHNQGNWIDYEDSEYIPVKNKCGTSACAMGWAAISGEFENIRVDKDFYETEELLYFLGEKNNIDVAAIKEFGEKTCWYVFMNTEASKCDTIKALRNRVKQLKEELEREDRKVV